jgi:hypothetical protein
MATTWIEIVESDFAGFTIPAATLTVSTALVLAVAQRRDKARPPRRLRK